MIRARSAPPWIPALLAGLLTGLLTAGPACALDPSRPLSQSVKDRWGVDQGLPVEIVTVLLQSHDGYLWVGTQEGLLRFDGVRFERFDRATVPEMHSSWIHALFEDRAGRLWIGTDAGGILCYDGGRFRSFQIQDGLPQATVLSLAGGPAGEVWIGTLGGLARLDETPRGPVIHAVLGLPPDTGVTALALDRSGTLWVGTTHGLYRREGREGGSLAAAPGAGALASSLVKRLRLDRQGTVWVAAMSGIFRKTPRGFESVAAPAGLGGRPPFELRPDAQGALWIGTDRGLLRLLPGGGAESLPPAEPLATADVGAVLEDREGNVWVGSNGAGLWRLKDAAATTLGQTEGLAADAVLSVTQTPGGEVWVGLDGGGIAHWDGGAFRVNPLGKAQVWAVLGDAAGVLAGTDRSGLLAVRDGRIERLATFAQAPYIRALLRDRTGALWIGTDSEGLRRLRGGVVEDVSARIGLERQTVWAMQEDRRGRLWLGTSGKGLFRLDGDRIEHWGAKDGLGSDSVVSFHEDDRGVMWVGTFGGGLQRWTGTGHAAITVREGLPDDVAFAILEDGQGYLWLSSNHGITRVARNQLDAVAAGRRSRVEATPLGKPDGMRTPECNGGSSPSAWKTADGRLWFPTMRGAAVIDPRRLYLNPAPPPLALEAVVADGEALPLSAGLEKAGRARLRAGTRAVELRYTALSLKAAEKIRFRYRLEGFDPDWIEAGDRRFARYTHLPPGAHTFRVTACNNDGVWNPAGVAYRFEVAPYYYQTPWFWALLGASAAAAAWALHRWRVRRVEAGYQALVAERSRVARELHDSLSHHLAGVGFQVEAAAQRLESGGVQAFLQRALELVRGAQGELHNLVWDLRPAALGTASLAEALARLADRLTAGTEVEHALRTEGNVADVAPLPENVEKHTLRIAQEALTNALRHGRPRRIETRLSYRPEGLTLAVRDDGRGMPAGAAERAAGSGLRGMRERAAALGGTLEIDSRPGSTEIKLQVPRKRLD